MIPTTVAAVAIYTDFIPVNARPDDHGLVPSVQSSTTILTSRLQVVHLCWDDLINLCHLNLFWPSANYRFRRSKRFYTRKSRNCSAPIELLSQFASSAALETCQAWTLAGSQSTRRARPSNHYDLEEFNRRLFA